MSEDASIVLNPPQDEVEVTAASGMRILPKVEITKPASLDIPNEWGAAETMTRKDSLSSRVSETELMPQRSSAIHLVAPYIDQSPSDQCSKTESIDERALAGGHEDHRGWFWPFLGEYDEADEAETALESTCRGSEENVGRVLPIGLSHYLNSEKLDHTGGKPRGYVDKFLPPHQVSISNPELGVRDRASLIQERTGEFSRHGSDRSSLKTATFDDTTEVPVSSSSSHKNTAAECDQTVMVIDQDPGVTRPDIPVPLLPRIRALFVGGTCSGKTSLISRYIYGSETLANANDFTRVLTPHYKACSVQLDSGTTSFELVLWDSPGPINDRLLPDMVQNISEAIGCIVLCFAVDEPELVSDIDTVWAPRLRELFPQKPLILAGTKMDLRITDKVHGMNEPCSSREGFQIQERIGAVNYTDCSAKTGEGVEELMKEIIVQSLGYKQRMNSHGRMKNIWRRSMGWLSNKP
ncbi:Ras-like GTP-binding protein Rho1 [Colletotrichum fructicola Nara gc5]|uniref:Ras-like GTP-binding protein Rho1 n=1 Tax=Colletotrichum fructicola (strain Nara gc5) TaxID=1213859 RepID=A0A7J6IPD7_COLFN|nr:Ras-like GTP-binding protein Rho1 [Colletotrichum fructicola Nara gc5]